MIKIVWIGVLLVCTAGAHYDAGHAPGVRNDGQQNPTGGAQLVQEHRLQTIEERQYSGGFVPSPPMPTDYQAPLPGSDYQPQLPMQPQYGSAMPPQPMPQNDYAAPQLNQQYGSPTVPLPQPAQYGGPHVPQMAPQDYSVPPAAHYPPAPASGYGAPVPQSAPYGQPAYDTPYPVEYGYVDMEGIEGYAEESKWSKFNSMVQKNIKDSFDKQKERFAALKEMKKEMAENIKNHLKSKKPEPEPAYDYPPSYGPPPPPAYGGYPSDVPSAPLPVPYPVEPAYTNSYPAPVPAVVIPAPPSPVAPAYGK